MTQKEQVLAFLFESRPENFENSGFEDEKYFRTVQQNYLDKQDEKFVSMLFFTMELIKTRKLYVMDKEYMSPCLCERMYISKNRVVLMGDSYSENKAIDLSRKRILESKNRTNTIRILKSNFDNYDLDRAYQLEADVTNFGSEESFGKYQKYFGGKTSDETSNWIKSVFKRMNKFRIATYYGIEFEASCLFFDMSGHLVIAHER